MIIKGENASKAINELIEYCNDTQKANKNIEAYYDNKNWTWYLDIKKNSQVIGKLLPFIDSFKAINVDLDSVIITIVSLFHYAKNKSRYYKLPDRFLTLRNQLSKNKTTQIIYILSKANLVEIKKEGNDIWVKLNTKILCNDIYLKTKRNRFKKADKQKLNICKKKYKTVFFYPYAQKTVNNSKKRDILGLTLAFNELLEPFMPIEQKKLEETFGKRQDIKYVEIPVKLISKILGIKESQLRNYIHKLYKFTNYISKHDKVYIDSHNMKHFYNDFYKHCDLTEVKNTELEEGHPEVTSNSAIIHNYKFENSKVGKYVLAHIKEYKATIIRELNFLKLDSLISGTNFKIEDIMGTEEDANMDNVDVNEDIKKSDIPNEFRDFVFDNMGNQQCAVINYTALKEKKVAEKRTKWLKIEHPESLTFSQCCSFINTILKKLEDCRNNEIKHYLKLFDKVKETFDKYILKFKTNNELDKIYNKLNKYPFLYNLI